MLHHISLKFLFLLGCWISATSTKPIMVTFGTNQGTITPYYAPTTPKPKTVVPRSPAPIAEATEDIPNPIVYRPPVPHQYRSKLYSFIPKMNLVLGTPLDIKYSPGISKYDVYKKQLAKSFGREYTGPHLFDRQAYEDDLQKVPQVDGTILHHQQLQKQQQQQLLQKQQQQQQQPQKQQGNYVPEIGVVYSAGVRYYVPQLVFYAENEDLENSVYDNNDVKHVQLRQK